MRVDTWSNHDFLAQILLYFRKKNKNKNMSCMDLSLDNFNDSFLVWIEFNFFYKLLWNLILSQNVGFENFLIY